MDSGQAASGLITLLQILFLDLVLSGDNAAVIAMACRTLPRQDASKAIVLGAAGAIVFRVLLTSIATLLIGIPYLKTVSAFLLIVIAVNLSAAEPGDEDLRIGGNRPRGDIVAAALVIVMADAIMSLDNVVALAAITAGNFWLLVLGLALSIPLLVFGSAAMALLLDRFPALVVFGGLLLGWTAGDLAASDAAYSDWIARQAPALAFVLPMAGAVFVWFQARWIVAERRSSPARPPRQPAPAVPPPRPKKQPPTPRPAPAPALASVATAEDAPTQ
ncbi:hypothetical protein CCR94_13775, partial [Rhodoblastus sphagnicola]